MAETTQFIIGDGASCTDGVCGTVTRVVIDPVARAVTHLVVEPKHGSGLDRLVPLDLLDPDAQGIRLRCKLAEFDDLRPAEETQFLPGDDGVDRGYGPLEALAWPYYTLGGLGVGGLGAESAYHPVTHDTVPLGEVAVQRGECVHAVDGDIGHVEGLVIDPRSHHVSHVLLQDGHLWGRKQVAIPIGAVTDVDDGIRLNLVKRQVRDLPGVDAHRPAAK